MNLQLVGCSHHHSSIAIRERLAFSESQVRPFLERFYKEFPQSEAVLLSTCNRTEFYTASKEAELLPSTDEMVAFLAAQSGLNSKEVQSNLFTHTNRHAVKHLFTVASSLDSMVIGETQILAQVKKAYRMAVETNEALSLTHFVFQSAIRVARRVSNETEIHSSRVSVPSVAIGVLARQIFERLDNKRILIVGAGEMAEETLRYVQDDGGHDIVVVNRTRSKAEELAAKFQGRVVEWSELTTQLIEADLIVSTTGATEPVVTNRMFQEIEKPRQQKPLFILDLAVPRDFEPGIGDFLNVYLYTLDDLQRECERNRSLRNSQLLKAEHILEQETDQFFVEVKRRSSGATIAQLKRQADEVKQVELRRLMNKLELDPDSQREVEYSFNRLVNKLLHPPLESLRDHSANESHHGLLDALKRLFQLGD
jgi:glutamyl-tRNA reductase